MAAFRRVMKFAPLLLLLCLQFVPGVGTGEAQAACTGSLSARTDCDTRAEAVEWLNTNLATVACSSPYPISGRIAVDSAAKPGEAVGWRYCENSSGTEYPAFGKTVYYPAANDGCPSGTTWDEPSKTCFSPEACLAKPRMGEAFATGPAPFDVACVDGCAFESGGGVDVLLPRSDGTWLGTTTGWEPTGEACPAGAPEAESATAPQVCEPAPDGQSFCIKPNGQHCYSLTNGSGRQICWRPGETGEKASANALQVRNGGTSATPPTTPPPPGDSFVQDAGSVTKTVTVNGTTITTTTTNYVTGSGTNAGPEDSGEPGDGSGSASGESGDAPEFDEPTVPEAPGVPWGELPAQSEWSANLGGSAACPAPVVVNVGIGDVMTDLAFEFQPLCDLADRVYWLLVGLGLLIGAYIVAGVRR